MTEMRKETDSLGVVEVPADKLWGAQTQRSLEHFSIGKDLMPREMITAYATLKKAAAIVNNQGKRLDDQRCKLIVQACDEILAGRHHDMFPLHVWMSGSGTQFNMNVNEARHSAAIHRPIPMTTSTWGNRRTTRFPRRCASPPPSM
jgi:fumarate hydratase class II